MDLNKAIQSRKSVRRFSQKKPDWKDIIECVDSARYSPMAGGNYTLKFIIVNNPETIQKLADASNQSFICQAQYVVIVCANPSRTINAYEERGEKYCRQQAGAAIQNFLLKIEEKGLATCWVGAFTDEIVKRVLKIPENIDLEAIFPVGYELEKNKPKRKIELDNILYFEKYENKKMKTPKKLNA